MVTTSVIGMFKKIAAGITLGISIVFCMLLDDPAVKAWVEQKLARSFESAFACKVACKIDTMHLFAPRITFAEFNVTPVQGNDWRWSCNNLVLSFDPLLLVRCICCVQITIEDFALQSLVKNNELAINAHLQKLMEDSKLPFQVILQRFDFNRAHIALQHEDGSSSAWLKGKLIVDGFKQPKIDLTLFDGNIVHDNKLVMQKISLQGNYADQGAFQGRFQLPSVTKQQNIVLQGTCTQEKVLFSLQSEDESLQLNNIEITLDKEHCLKGKIILPLEKVGPLLAQHLPLQGTCEISGSASWREGKPDVQGSLVIRDLSYKNTPLAKVANGTFRADSSSIFATLKAEHSLLRAQATASYDLTKKSGSCALKADSSELFGVRVNDFHIEAKLVDTNKVSGKHTMTLGKKEQSTLVQGSFTAQLSANALALQGNCNDYTYQITSPRSCDSATVFTCKDASNTRCFSGFITQDLLFTATLENDFIKKVLSMCVAVELPGRTDVHITGSLQNTITGTIELQKTAIRIPNTYNCITGFKSNFACDFHNSSLTLEEVKARLYRGSVAIDHAQVHWCKEGVSQLYVPLVFNKCFFSLHKELFALVSGSLIIEKKNSAPAHVSGAILIDKGQLKENIFSKNFQKRLSELTSSSAQTFPFDLTAHLTLETKDALRVKTALLDTTAHFALRIEKEGKQPKLSGKITLRSGSIAFPYKPLLIQKGSLTFDSEKKNPLIEFVAKNTLKKNKVMLQIMGELDQPSVILESSPALSQEQIICLLLTGSQDSLVGVVPATLTRAMKHMLFDTEHTPTALHSAITQLFSPFKHIYLIPSFSDQTSRGGLRGALEIDIGERWRALLQKNFSLSEDTRLELEYAISDDIFVRGFKDERQDIGAEIEFRWKF